MMATGPSYSSSTFSLGEALAVMILPLRTELAPTLVARLER
jgi:hypothetical protein